MLRPMPIAPIPPATARVARAAFPKGNRYRRVADELASAETRDLVGHGRASILPFDKGDPGGIYQVWRLTKSSHPPFAKGGEDTQYPKRFPEHALAC
jgi:hypothetical protein